MKKLFSIISIFFAISAALTGSIKSTHALTDHAASQEWLSIFANVPNAYSLIFDMDLDGQENIYVTGASSGAWGMPLHEHSGSGEDIFIAKFDKHKNLIWNTFLGGVGNERGNGITVDKNGNVYIAGNGQGLWEPQDTLIPLSFPNGTVSSAFVAKLGSSGEVQWYTFPISSENSYGNSIAVDSAGNILMVGTGSDVAPNSGFLIKLDPDGTALWSNDIGSEGWDISLDSNDNIFIVGNSEFAWGTPVRAYSGGHDIFVAKISSAGTPQWNTFLGGTGADLGFTIALDENGDIYAGGRSYAGWGTPVRPYRANDDAVVAKLTNDGNLAWHTFLGNTQSDEGWGITLDNDVIYVCGVSASSWGTPLWPYTGGDDAFVAGLDKNGTLRWNGFLGRKGEDECLAVAGLGNEYLYVGGFIGTTITESAFLAKIGPELPRGFAKLAPANGTLLQSPDLNLNWTPSNGATYYTYCYDTINNNICDTTWQNAGISTNAAITGLDSGQTYYWQVRAGNAAGTVGANASTWWKFSTRLDPTLLVLPLYEEQLLTLRPTLDWEDVNNASHYILQISRDENFTKLVKTILLAGTEYIPNSDLPRNTKLFWRVRPRNTSSAGPWTAWRSFTTGSPPSIPILAAPANGALIRNYTPTFDWSNAKAPTGTAFKTYEIEVDDNKDFSSTAIHAYTELTDVSKSSYTHDTGLDPNTRYYWRVRAIGVSNGNEHSSAWSPVWSVRTAILSPELLSPANLSTGVAPKPTFSWQSVDGASNYTIQASTTQSFESLNINTTTAALFYTPATGLPSNKQIFWRVRANGQNGPSAWSQVWSFNGPFLAAPAITAPTEGAAVRIPVELKWTAVPRATKYQVRYAPSGSDVYVTQPAQTELSFTLYQRNQWVWQVRAGDSIGNWSEWSTPSSFEALPGPFSATPAITFPASGTTIDTLKPQIKWTIPLHAGGWQYGDDRYRIQFDNNDDFNSPEYDGLQNSYTYEGELPDRLGVDTLKQKDWLPALGDQMDIPPDGTYYVRVQGVTSDGLTSDWSAPITLNLQLSYSSCSPASDGLQVYNFSWGPYTENRPKLMSLTLSDQLPDQNETVDVSVNMVVEPFQTEPAPPLDPITSLVLYVYTDHQISAPIPLTLTSGTGTNGTWQGQWTPEDTFCFRYRYRMEATNNAATIPFDIVIRDVD